MEYAGAPSRRAPRDPLTSCWSRARGRSHGRAQARQHGFRGRALAPAATCSVGPRTATSFALLDRFVGTGFNLIDTADSYSRWVTGHRGGESETIIGRWIARRGHHGDVIVATKVGSDMGQGHKVLRKEYILRAVEARA
jgi:aryl-alcohol dehydrogenase-like predicted oxidoreductase